MTLWALLDELARRGVTLTLLDDGRLRASGGLWADLRPTMRHYRAHLAVWTVAQPDVAQLEAWLEDGTLERIAVLRLPTARPDEPIVLDGPPPGGAYWLATSFLRQWRASLVGEHLGAGPEDPTPIVGGGWGMRYWAHRCRLLVETVRAALAAASGNTPSLI